MTTPDFCLSCVSAHATILVSNDCICEDGLYWNSSLVVCAACHSSCLTCDGPSALYCLTCDPALNLILSAPQCLCDSGFYLSDTSGLCLPCYSTCSECVGPSVYNCSACYAGHYLVGSYCRPQLICTNYRYEDTCVNVCPKTSYPDLATHSCIKCVMGCRHCSTSTSCLVCDDGYYFDGVTATCSPACPLGQYILGTLCLDCPLSCTRCYASTPSNVSCSECQVGYFVQQGQCVNTCLAPRFYVNGMQCLGCIGNCETCGSISVSDCLTCKPSTSFLNNECYHVCPPTYFSNSTHCLACPVNCLSCFLDSCLACSQGFYLWDNSCI